MDGIMPPEASQQNDAPAWLSEPDGRRDRSLHQSDNSEYRGRIDSFTERLVVEADITPGYGRFEECARFSNAFYRLDQLRHDFRAFRITEIQIVGCGHRHSTRNRQIP